MKKIWKFDRIGGIELEVSDDFPVQIPFTDVPPIDGIPLEEQFFIPTQRRWKLLSNGIDREKLDNLDALYSSLEGQYKEVSTQLTDTQLALVDVYESLEGVK